MTATTLKHMTVKITFTQQELADAGSLSVMLDRRLARVRRRVMREAIAVMNGGRAPEPEADATTD